MPPTALRRLAAVARPDPAADPALVRAFLLARDEDAFAELVRRHGPMVLAVCRRVLGHREDAEDAFQAAFLVLARKAASVRGANLAGWLYAVAVRTARGVRVMRDRRKRHELASGGSEPPDSSRHQGADAPRSPEQAELASIVDEVLAGLPEHYRVPVVLCELQGRSRKDAATELCIPEGTLSSRLAAARRKLADRLAERGVTAPAAGLGVVLVPAAGPVAADLARAAVRVAVADGVASAVAAEAAAGVVKALLVARLKAGAVAVAVAAGFVGGVVVATVPGGVVAAAGPEQAPAPRPAAAPAALVKQLGDPQFAAREAAGKRLRDLGPKAVPALAAAARDPNPEVARRASAVLVQIRADALAAFAKGFDPAGTADYDHPIWQRFKSIAGGDRPARELFAGMIADPRRFRLLAAADDNSGGVGAVYAQETYHTYQAFRGLIDIPANRLPEPGAFTVADLATLLYLGTYPGTSTASAGWATERSLFLTRFEPGLKGPTATPLGRVFVAWLARREDRTTLEQGFGLAVKHGLAAALPVARRVAADAGRPVPARCAALPAVARFGTPADLPLFEPLFADDAELTAYWSTGHIPAGSKHDGIFRTRVKDYAVGMALLLHGEYPAAFGFPFLDPKYVRPPGRPDVAEYQPSHFAFQTTVGPGSLESAHRDAAHALARAWLAANAAADPPAKGSKVWDHFKAVVGDDKAARELFDRIAADPKSRELLEKAAAGDKGARELAVARSAELSKRASGADQAPPPEVLGWVLSQTFPAAAVRDGDRYSVHFFPAHLRDDAAARAFVREMTDGPRAAPVRKLVAAWANGQPLGPGGCFGLGLAVQFGIKDALPAARTVLAAYAKPDAAEVNRPTLGNALKLVGQFGAAADLPALAAFADSPLQCEAHISGDQRHRPADRVNEPIDGQDVGVQARDLAVAAQVARRGGKPEDFGFHWTKTDARKLIPWAAKVSDDPFGADTPIGFARPADRDAAHKKAREWLDKQNP